MTRAIQLCFLLLLFIACSDCNKLTSLRHKQDYANNYSGYHQVLVMPIYTVDFDDKRERLYDYEYHIQYLISSRVVSALEAKGFRAKLLHKNDIKELRLGKEILSFRGKYNHLRQEFYTPLQLEESKAYTIDKSVGHFGVDIGEKTQSDLLVLIDYLGLIKTNGARARDLAVSLVFGSHSGAGSNNSVIFIGLVEAKSGNIL